jgi:two-component system, OmpR family, KDP operon response regulator KdpE
MLSKMSALIVEDDVQMRQLLSDILQEAQVHKVAVAGTVQEAHDQCQANRFAFALLDVGLGDEDGLDFLRSLRSETSHPLNDMPVLVISGRANQDTIERAKEAGANGYVVKPVWTDDLLRRIELAIRPQPQMA